MEELKPCRFAAGKQMLLFVAGFSSLSVRVAVHLLTGSIQNKKQSKHGTGGLTMGIQERIDALSEAEAKAALGSVIMTIALQEPCRMSDSDYCPYYSKCNASGTNECAKLWLDEALKEAQK